jgi:hypothetical protein
MILPATSVAAGIRRGVRLITIYCSCYGSLLAQLRTVLSSVIQQQFCNVEYEMSPRRDIGRGVEVN